MKKRKCSLAEKWGSVRSKALSCMAVLLVATMVLSMVPSFALAAEGDAVISASEVEQTTKADRDDGTDTDAKRESVKSETEDNDSETASDNTESDAERKRVETVTEDNDSETVNNDTEPNTVNYDSEIAPVAADPIDQVSYWDSGIDVLGEAVETPGMKSADHVTVIDSDTTEWGSESAKEDDPAWYIVNGKVAIDERITVKGYVSLILADHAELNAKKGINVGPNTGLTIWGQSDWSNSENKNNLGKLVADLSGDSVSRDAAIGGNRDQDCGTITISGGIIEAKGGTGGDRVGGAAIGGGYNGYGGWYGPSNSKIYITGGIINAIGGDAGAGIGGGHKAGGQAILIGAGDITAVGGARGGAGIGGGYRGECSYSQISGGKVKATGGKDGGAGIGGGYMSSLNMFSVVDGEIEAVGGEGGGAGIGGGYQGSSYSVNIHGGKVEATGGKKGGAGIGGGYDRYGQEIRVNNGTVTATGGEGGGAGIGGGYGSYGREIRVNNGTVTATGGEGGGAGIGGGYQGRGINIEIQDGNIEAIGGEKGGAGIGGGYQSSGGGYESSNEQITINKGTVHAIGKGGGAGIGGGGTDSINDGKANGKGIYINGGEITAVGGDDGGAGIGGGYGNYGNDIYVKNGTVKAYGGKAGGAGIGGGAESYAYSIYVYDGEVTAVGGENGGAGIGCGLGSSGGDLSYYLYGGTIHAISQGESSAVGAGVDARGTNVKIDGATLIAFSAGGSVFDKTTIPDFYPRSSYYKHVTYGNTKAEESDELVEWTSNPADMDAWNQWKWVKIQPGILVTFDTVGGSEVANQIVPDGGKVTRPKDPTLGSRDFDGWYTDRNYGQVFDFDSVTVTEDTTIYAKWKKPDSTKAEYYDPALNYDTGKTEGEAGIKTTDVNVTEIDSNTTGLNDTGNNKGWYIVYDNIALNRRLEVTGNVNLILARGGYLDLSSGGYNGGIHVAEGNSLTIWGDTGNYNLDGGLNAKVSGSNMPYAAIGGNREEASGTITINGGNITALNQGSADSYGAGIGGGSGKSNGTITINGGLVNAKVTGGGWRTWGAAIGAGRDADSGKITINGGKVIANSYDYAAAIGGGYSGDGQNITINGGNIEAKADIPTVGLDTYSAAIGGGYYGNGHDIKITGGKINANGCDYGTGIGGGSNGDGYDITITGGEITAVNGEARPIVYTSGAGIGGGVNGSGYNITINDDDHELILEAGSVRGGAGIGGGYGGSGHHITISGGTITATGNNNGGAGIGGGINANAKNITIEGGNITATGGTDGGAGIGGGAASYGEQNKTQTDKIIIAGGTVNAYGGRNGGAGIGSGADTNPSVTNTEVRGGTVTAIGNGGGAGIGGGKSSTATTIKISDAKVNAIGYNEKDYFDIGGAGIGGGFSRGGNAITISNSDVIAKAGFGAAGIGGGYESGTSGVTITNSTVEAYGGAPYTDGRSTKSSSGAGIGNGQNRDPIANEIIKITESDVIAVAGDSNTPAIPAVPTLTYEKGHVTLGNEKANKPAAKAVEWNGNEKSLEEWKKWHWAHIVKGVALSFDTQGGSYIEPQIFTEGSGTSERPDRVPSRWGHEFQGWYNESDCKTEFAFGSTIDKTTIAYAKWEELSEDEYESDVILYVPFDENFEEHPVSDDAVKDYEDKTGNFDVELTKGEFDPSVVHEGYANYFNGDDRLDASLIESDDIKLSELESLTVSFSVKADASDGKSRYAFSLGRKFGFFFRNGHFRVDVPNGNELELKNFATDTWYDIKIVFDKEEIRIYIDDVLAHTISSWYGYRGLQSVLDGNSGDPFVSIGGAFPFSSQTDLIGAIDEFKVYKGTADYTDPGDATIDITDDTIYVDNTLPDLKSLQYSFSYKKGDKEIWSKYQPLIEVTKGKHVNSGSVPTEKVTTIDNGLWALNLPTDKDVTQIKIKGIHKLTGVSDESKYRSKFRETKAIAVNKFKDGINCVYLSPWVQEKDQNEGIGSHLGKVDEINTIGASGQDIAKGAFVKDTSGNTYYGSANFYNYYSDYELWAGEKLSTSKQAYKSEDYWGDQPVYSINRAIANYYKDEINDNILYFGGARMLYYQEKQDNHGEYYDDAGNRTAIDLRWKYLHAPNYFSDVLQFGNDNNFVHQEVQTPPASDDYESALEYYPMQGILGSDQLTADNNNVTLGNSAKASPMFNKAFLEGENAESVQFGTAYENVQFPFKQNENGYWCYDSIGQTALRMTENTARSDVQYFLDETNNPVHYTDVDNKTGQELSSANYFFPFTEGGIYQNTPGDAFAGIEGAKGNVSNLDYMFGASINIPFSLNASGKVLMTQTAKDAEGNEKKEIVERDTVFTFSGDDDIWIFLQDPENPEIYHLVLDIGGSHGRVSGAIDFTTGYAAVSGKYTPFRSSTVSAMNKQKFLDIVETDGISFTEDGSNSGTMDAYKDYIWYAPLKDLIGNEKYDAYKEYYIKIFYMERGLDQSNFRMTFNFAGEDTASVTKEWEYDDNDAMLKDEANSADVTLYRVLANEKDNGDGLAAETGFEEQAFGIRGMSRGNKLTGGEIDKDPEHDVVFKDDDYDGRDDHFETNVTLNGEDGWRVAWALRATDTDEAADKTTYDYYVAETESNPLGYAPVYYDNSDPKNPVKLTPVKLKVSQYGDDSGATTEIFAVPVGNTGDKDKNGKDINIPVLIKNEPSISLSLLKVDAKTEKALEGAAFTLTYPDGRVEDVTVDHDGTATFEKLVAGEYTLEETTAPNGYKITEKIKFTVAYDQTAETFTVTPAESNENYTFEMSKDEKDNAVIQVTVKDETSVGNLKVSKTVGGAFGDTNKLFAFTVTLKGKYKLHTEEFDASKITGIYGGMEFKDGVAKFKLKHNESVTAENLPSGIQYTVVESDNGDYTVSKSGDVGKILEEKTVEAAFTNNRDAAYGDLIISKTVAASAVGEAVKDGSFQFTITLTDAQNKPLTGEITVTIDGKDSTETLDDEGKITVTLQNGKSATIKGLLAGTKYKVEETANDMYVTTVDGEEKSVAEGAIIEGNSAVAFVNTRATADLPIQKTVKGLDTDKTFKFNVTLDDTTINGDFDLYYILGNAETKAGSVHFTNGAAIGVEVPANQTAVIKGLPYGTNYTVTEELTGMAGKYDTTANGKDKTATSGTVTGKDTASFVNTRTTGKLVISKTVLDENGQPDSTDTTAFHFNVELSAEITDSFNAVLQKADGSTTDTTVDFKDGKSTSDIVLQHGQTLTISDLPAGITYTVTEGPDASYLPSSENASEQIPNHDSITAAFTNTKKAGASLIISKEVTGPYTGETFTFTVKIYKDSNKTELYEDVDGTYGTIVFEKGTATVELKDNDVASATGLPDGIYYTVTEVQDQDGYTVQGDAVRNGSIVSGETKTERFVNDRNTANLSLTKSVGYSDSDEILTDEETVFAFTVKLEDANKNPVSGQFTATYKDADSVEVTFDENGETILYLMADQTATIEGLPVNITYTITENLPEGSDYTLQDGDDHTGTLSEDTAVTFVNVKEKEVIKYGGLTVSKTVTGTAGETDKPFTFTVTLQDGDDINGEYGNMTFKNGVAKFTLQHGEQKTAAGLPAGISYTVTESDNDGYTVTKTGDTGTIPADDTAEAKFTNHKDADTPSETPPDEGDSSKDNSSDDREGDTSESSKTPSESEASDTASDLPLTSTVNLPATGDQTNLGLWYGLAGLSLCGLGVAVVLLKRKAMTGKRGEHTK